MGNGLHGVSVEDTVERTTIGLAIAFAITHGCTGACNRISHNVGDGVRIEDDSQRTTIRSNEIVRNQRLAIDLGADGPTANDLGRNTTASDEDDGPNDLQNFPVAVLATTDPLSGVRTVSGVVDSPSPRT